MAFHRICQRLDKLLCIIKSSQDAYESLIRVMTLLLLKCEKKKKSAPSVCLISLTISNICIHNLKPSDLHAPNALTIGKKLTLVVHLILIDEAPKKDILSKDL